LPLAIIFRAFGDPQFGSWTFESKPPAVGEAVGNIIDAFFEIGEKEFRFLVDEFGFKKKANKTDVEVYRLRYEYKTTNVEIGFEWRDQYINVLLGRCDREKPQRMPRPEDELLAFSLEDLLKFRTGKYAIDQDRFGKALTRKDINEILNTYARGLREHGADVLQGDFSVFSELEKIVRKRMKDHALA
jgi:hypothetical protein